MDLLKKGKKFKFIQILKIENYLDALTFLRKSE